MRILTFLIVGTLLLPVTARAHPHIWIDATLGIVMQGGRITALDVTWTFDELYSELVQQDFDLDGDGVLSQQELDALVGVSAANLMEFSFFTHVRVGTELRPISAVREFYAEVRDGQVLYRFRVPFAEPLDPRGQPVAIGLFDDSYYVDIGLPAADISLPGASGCSARLEQALDQPLYYGTFFPTYARVECAGG